MMLHRIRRMRAVGRRACSGLVPWRRRLQEIGTFSSALCVLAVFGVGTESSTVLALRSELAASLSSGPAEADPSGIEIGTGAGEGCAGDCNGDQRVTVSELVLGAAIALGDAAVSQCTAADGDGGGTVSVDELVRAVAAALEGCNGAPTPSPTTPPNCGDGTAQVGEGCDDGNRVSGDGCSAQCQLEPGGDVCAGVPTVRGTEVRAELVASGLNAPAYATTPPLDPNRLFIVEQAGRIRIVENGTLLAAPFLDITERVSAGGERGLFSMAFHPDYERNGWFFLNYTDDDGNSVIARYEVSGDRNRADASSELVLLHIVQPFPNHNGGLLLFGPDGLLYTGMGDGGGAGDPNENAQSDQTVLGKMLRLDADAASAPYLRVPPDNPNAAAGIPLGLIWAKGLRNPWRFSFDHLTGDFYVADVGQDQWEEVSVDAAPVTGGQNYGWDVFEGTQCFDPAPLFGGCPDPLPAGWVHPVVQYNHGEGQAITGGFVYRGCAMPDLHGTYFYADFIAGFVRSFVFSSGTATDRRDWTEELTAGGSAPLMNIASFGEDARGELYICDLAGSVFKIVPR